MIPQTNVDAAVAFFAARIGDAYVYGGMFSPHQHICGHRLLRHVRHDPADPHHRQRRPGRRQRQLHPHRDHRIWPYNYLADLAVAVGTVGPYGTICAGDAQPGPAPTVYPPQIPADAAAIIYLMHGGGGEDSHMMIVVNGVVMETGGQP